MVIIKTPPSKNMDKDDTTPVIRRQTIILRENPTIPDSRWEDDHANEGRQLAFDAVTTYTPVLTSARKKEADKESTEDFNDVLNALFSLSIGGKAFSPPKTTVSSPQKKAAIVVPDKVASVVREKKQEDDDDEDWIAPTESEDSESVSTTVSEGYIDSEADDELDWGFKEKDDNVTLKDLYSPENAKGSFHYTVLSPEKGVTHNIRRSSRNSFSSPVGMHNKKK